MKRAGGLAALILALGVASFAFFQTASFLPAAASREAGPVDGLLRLVLGIAAAIGALVLVIMGYALVAFRRRPGDLHEGRPLHGHTPLELTWTAVPLAIVIGVGVYAHSVWQEIRGSADPRDDLVVDVTAFQFGWQFHYPTQGVTSGELVLPQGAPVFLRLAARDVIHSFWVPEFRLKMDAVPGQETHLRLTPTERGQFQVRCAEFCGLAHAYMLARVRVVDLSEFRAWLSAQPGPSAGVPPAEPRVGALPAGEGPEGGPQ